MYTVPTPSVSLTAPDSQTAPFEPQTVGRRLMLQCEVTTVRGITSGVDVVWSRDGAEVERITGLSVTSTTANTVVYSDSYNTLEPLRLNDTGTVFQCKVMINTNPPVMDNDNFTLEVTGKLNYYMCCILYIKAQIFKHVATYISQQMPGFFFLLRNWYVYTYVHPQAINNHSHEVKPK